MYSKGDPQMAARVIDDALADEPDAADVLLVQAQILRAEAAHALGDDALAERLLGQAVRAVLEPDERLAIADDLARADELLLAVAGGTSAPVSRP